MTAAAAAITPVTTFPKKVLVRAVLDGSDGSLARLERPTTKMPTKQQTVINAQTTLATKLFATLATKKDRKVDRAQTITKKIFLKSELIPVAPPTLGN